jgi:Zn-dependent M28 family amino/carboxypeptidase
VAELQRAVLASHGAVDTVSSLTTEVGARLAGSPADKLAVAWAIHAMEERGLTNVHAEPVKVPTWQRGVETASIVSPIAHVLAVTALGWSGATPPKGIEAEVVRFESLDALRSADAKTVTGKIAFIDVKMERTSSGKGYGDAVPARGAGPLEAKKRGALAVVIRSIGTDRSRFPHTGATRQKDPKTALPAAALSVADAELLDREIAAHGTVRLALNLGPKWLPESDSANVVGEVAGGEKPGEVVVLGAHLDSWDLGQGAIDDGAGCGIVLEAGRAIAALGHKPRRTVRVVLFAAEENSLAGGTTYAKTHAADADHIVAALEADSGTDRVLSARYGGAKDARARFTALGPLLAPLGIKLDDGAAFGGADVSPLRGLGVPMVDLEQDFSSYFDTHHTANDTFERVSPEGIQQAAAAFATAGWTIANMDGDFGRVPEAERSSRF